MRWNRELNPIVVGVVCLVGSLLVLDQSFRLVLRDASKATVQADVLSEELLAELPADNLHRRLAVVKERIRELEVEREGLQKQRQDPSKLAEDARIEHLPREQQEDIRKHRRGVFWIFPDVKPAEIAQIDKMLRVLRAEEQKVIAAIAANPPEDLAF